MEKKNLRFQNEKLEAQEINKLAKDLNLNRLL